MRPGGVAIFHEYAHYLTWRFVPRLPNQERFAQEVKASWGAAGGKADIGLDLPIYLAQNGFVLRWTLPRIYCVGPSDYMWQWPGTFVPIGLARLQELGRIDAAFAERVRHEVAEAGSQSERSDDYTTSSRNRGRESLITSLCCMPWTLSHPAIVLPLRRFSPRPFDFAALVIGSMTPDIGFYIDRFDLSDIRAYLAGQFSRLSSHRGDYALCLLLVLPAGLLCSTLASPAGSAPALPRLPLRAKALGDYPSLTPAWRLDS